MKKNLSDSVKKEFLDICAAVCDLKDDEIFHGPDDSFRPHLDKLNRLAATDVDDDMAEEIRCDSEFQSAVKLISRVKRLNGLKMETDSARSVISAHDPWARLKDFIYYPNYLQLARMEYQGANLRSGDQVVFLGSGPLPLSLISLCRQYNIEGIGIEQAGEYARLSQELIETLELTNRIRIIQGNHFSLPLQAEECQLVMVGADALPKDEIFAHLAKALPDGAKLSYRIYEKGLRRLLDYQSVFDLPAVFREYARVRPEPPVNNTSVFVIKDSKMA